ncbi:Ca2+-binding RTX toxin-like protein [Sinorhizobium fredii]
MCIFIVPGKGGLDLPVEVGAVRAGGAGDDFLIAGAGADQFVFNAFLSEAGTDLVSDFLSRAQNATVFDRIVLDKAAGLFAQVGPNGTLKGAAFWSSTTGEAHDASDRIIYNTTNGWLTYDSNGNAKWRHRRSFRNITGTLSAGNGFSNV